LESELEQIEGIGTKTADKLLVQFKSVSRIKQASLEELKAVVSRAQAEAIHSFFRPSESQ